MNNTENTTKHFVSIEVGANIFSRYADLTNTVSHALGEFVDNAIQSYLDNKESLKSIIPNYKLKVIIDIEWDENTNRAKVITVSDNAAGLDKIHFLKAFKSAETPDNNTGLNEFGMGMNTAAGWLGNTWSLRSSALGENIERTNTFDLSYVLNNEVRELPYTIKDAETNSHYTYITITNPTNNSPKHNSLSKIKTELASIYRKFLRNDEMELYVCDEKLTFTNYPILVAPYVKNKDGEKKEWKTEINIEVGKYKAKGFIAILKDINSAHNGLVLIRRGRVIIGDEDGKRYYPNCLFNSAGTFRYKRLFGELELEGFDVSFNKNDIQDKDNLEFLMKCIQEKLKNQEYNLLYEADNYRIDDNTKKVKKLIDAHDRSSNRTIEVSYNPSDPKDVIAASTEVTETNNEIILGQTTDKYIINDIPYELEVKFVNNNGSELFWVDLNEIEEHKIVCKIDTAHIFFKTYKVDNSIVTILKALTISKFMSIEQGDGTAQTMYHLFNDSIKKIKI